MPADTKDKLIDVARELDQFFYGSGHIDTGAVFSCVASGARIAREKAEELRTVLAFRHLPDRVRMIMLTEANATRERLREHGDHVAAEYYVF